MKNFLVMLTICLLNPVLASASYHWSEIDHLKANPSVKKLQTFMTRPSKFSGSTEILTVGSDANCDFNMIQAAIDVIPPGTDNFEIRTANETGYQENLVINSHSIKIKGGYDDCLAADSDVENGSYTELDGSGASLPSISIINPANYVGREIIIENMDVSGGTGDHSLAVPGGGINAYNADADIFLVNVFVHDNLGELGGGVYVLGGNTTLYMEDVFILLNEALNGGGLYCDASTVFMYGFSGVAANSALGTVTQGSGGGVYATNACNYWMFSGTEGGIFDFRGIAGNKANQNGGGIYADSGSSIILFGQQLGSLGDNSSPVNVSKNEADADNNGQGTGGGVYADDTTISAFSLLLNGNESNDASAVYLTQTDFSMQRLDGDCWREQLCNQIKDNITKDITIPTNSTMIVLGADFTIEDTEVVGNRAGRDGFFFNQFGDVKLEGNVITGNGDNGMDGFGDKRLITLFRPNSFSMLYNTVVDNNLTEALIDLPVSDNKPAKVAGSIFSESNGVDVLGNGNDTDHIDFDCILTHESISFNGNNVVVGNPEFVNRNELNFHLLANSPAIDMCSEAEATPTGKDLDGQNRGWDAHNIVDVMGPFDAGVDEYRTATTADVSVQLNLDTVGPYYQGQVITYSATVDNLGPDSAENVMLDMTLDHMVLESITGASCVEFPCHVGDLFDQGSKTLTIETRILSNLDFDASMTVHSDIYDPLESNNLDLIGNGGVVTELFSDLSVELLLQTSPPYYNTQLVTYHAVMTNNGPDDIENAWLAQGNLLTNQIFHSISGAGCIELPCTIDFLASGESTEIITLVFEMGGPGSFSGSLRALTPPQSVWIDPEFGNNQATTESMNAQGLIDLEINKTLLTSGPFSVGQSIEYLIEFSNQGMDAAFMASISDLSENMTITSISGLTCTDFPCAVGNLQSGEGGQLTVVATIDEMGAFNNIASINSLSGFDPDLSNNVDDGSIDNNNGGIAVNSDLIFMAGFD